MLILNSVKYLNKSDLMRTYCECYQFCKKGVTDYDNKWKK